MPQTESPDFDSPSYRQSRRAYAAQCTLEYLVSLLVADAFLAKLLNRLGLDDATVGIISSLVSLSFLIQLLSLFLYRLNWNAKKLVLVFYPISQLLLSSVYLIPFLPIRGTAVKVTVMACILTAYVFQYLVYNVIFRWANSFVSPAHRASFSAAKEIVSLASGIVFTAVVGLAFDKFEAAGKLREGFLLLAVLAFVLSAANIFCVCRIRREEPQGRCGSGKTFREILSGTVGNRNFRSVILLTAIWETAKYMTVGFLGIYKTGDLMMTVFAVQVINIAANVVRMLVSRPFGKFSDKYSFAAGMALALSFAATAFLVNSFTTPATRWLIAVYAVLYAVALAGLNQNAFNITYSYVASDYITEAMAIKNCFGGLCGFGASLLGGGLLRTVQANGNRLFGITVYGQQLLSGISFCLTVVALLLTVFVVGRQKRLVQ